MDNMRTEVGNVYIKYWIENGILHGEYQPVKVEELSIVKEFVQLRVSLAGEQSLPFLLDGRKVISMNKKSRDYLGSEESEKGITAGAILVGSSVTEIIGNFFLRLNKPRIPARVFTDKDKAIAWLESYK